MHPGIRCGTFISTLLVVLFLLVSSSGCIQPTNSTSGPGSGQSYTQQATPAPAGPGSPGPDSTLVTPGTTQTGETPIQGANQTTANSTSGPLYPAGSSVQKNPADSSYDKDRGWVIVKVNEDGTYTVGQIYLDPEKKVWFRVNDELLVTRAIHAVERDYPVRKGSADWNSLPTKHGVVDRYGVTHLEW
jgi:hypothetical protein